MLTEQYLTNVKEQAEALQDMGLIKARKLLAFIDWVLEIEEPEE